MSYIQSRFKQCKYEPALKILLFLFLITDLNCLAILFQLIYGQLSWSCSRELSNLEKFRHQQKLIEAQNAKMRQMLTQAISERCETMLHLLYVYKYLCTGIAMITACMIIIPSQALYLQCWELPSQIQRLEQDVPRFTTFPIIYEQLP